MVSVGTNDSLSTVVTEVNEWIIVFNSLFSSLPIYDDDGSLVKLVPANLSNEVKELFFSRRQSPSKID